jgi:hypothetical protein
MTVTTKEIERTMLNAALKAINREATEICNTVESVYKSDLAEKYGKAETAKVIDVIGEIICLTIFGKGQKALIAEYGSGSLMDRNNPTFSSYIQDDVFNKERLKYNMATITRVNDDFYYDLDGNKIERPRPKNEVNLEKYNVWYAPVAPKHVIVTTIRERLNKIMENILEEVVLNVPFEELFNGREIKIGI